MANIIWIASYPKSGNTWVRSFIHNLLSGADQPAPIAELPRVFQGELKRRWYTPLAGGRPLEELTPDQVFAMRRQVHADIAASAPGTVFAKTHSPWGSYNQVPLQNPAVMTGAVYIVRNPLDVVLSVADHFGRSVDEAIDFLAVENNATPSDSENMMDFIGSWSLNVATWAAHQQHPRMVLVRYEDLLDRPQKAFGRIARLLGRDQDRDRIDRAIRFSSFAELRRQEEQQGFSERSPHSGHFFREGRKGQWKDRLSEDQVRRVVEAHYEQMAHFRYVPASYRR